MRFQSIIGGKRHKERTRSHNPEQEDFVTDCLYHRGAIDESLVGDLLELVEKHFHSLRSKANWSITLYILYSKVDSATFGGWGARRQLKRRLVDYYLNEVREANGPGESVEQRGLQAYGYSLSLPSVESSIQCRLKSYEDTSTGQSSVDLDLYLAEDNSSLTANGRLTTLIRIVPIVRDQKVVHGGLEFGGNIAISPHLDVSQRGARGESNIIYMTEPEASVVLGPHVGCDLYAPSLNEIAVLRTDGEELRAETCLRSLGRINTSEWRGNDFHLKYSISRDVGAGMSFGEVLEEREATEKLVLRVIGRVLPRPKGEGPGGYGSDWCELSSQVSRQVKVSIRLDAKSSLGIDSDDRLFVWLNTQKRLMEIGAQGLRFRVNERKYRWEPDNSGVFYGSLYFEDDDPQIIESRVDSFPPDKEATWIIARGTHSEFSSLLVNYAEDGLVSRRGSLIVHSNGRGAIEISVVNEKTGHLFFLENYDWRSTQQSTVNQKDRWAGRDQEFIFGSSRYQLGRNGKLYRKEKHWSGAFDFITKN